MFGNGSARLMAIAACGLLLVVSPKALAKEEKLPTSQPISLAAIITGLHSHDADTRVRQVRVEWSERARAECGRIANSLKGGVRGLPAEKRSFSDSSRHLIDAYAAPIPAVSRSSATDSGIRTRRPALRRCTISLRSNTPEGVAELFAERYPREADNPESHGVLARAMLNALPNERLHVVLIDALPGQNSPAWRPRSCWRPLNKETPARLPRRARTGNRRCFGRLVQTRLCPETPMAPPTLAQRWEEKYQGLLATAEYSPTCSATPVPAPFPTCGIGLRRRDPRLSCFAIVSLLKLGGHVGDEAIEAGRRRRRDAEPVL